MIIVDLQIATKNQKIPSKDFFALCVNEALKDKVDQVEICIRLIDKKESATLNKTYRSKKGSTNILSFPYTVDSSLEKMQLIGDLAICAEVVNEESIEQRTDPKTHWAHIVIHGCLHLAGYTHEDEQNAKIMEAEEATILNKLGYENPYQ